MNQPWLTSSGRHCAPSSVIVSIIVNAIGDSVLMRLPICAVR